MTKLKLNELETELPTTIGLRKNASIEASIYRRETKVRESLKERSCHEKSITAKRHEINKTKRENERDLLTEISAEQDYEMQREFIQNCRQYRRNLRRIAKKQAERTL